VKGVKGANGAKGGGKGRLVRVPYLTLFNCIGILVLHKYDFKTFTRQTCETVGIILI